MEFNLTRILADHLRQDKGAVVVGMLLRDDRRLAMLPKPVEGFADQLRAARLMRKLGPDHGHAGFVRDDGNGFFREIGMGIDAGSHGGSSQRQLAQGANRFFSTHRAKLRMSNITGDFLAKSDRCRILKMRASDLDDVIERGGFLI